MEKVLNEKSNKPYSSTKAIVSFVLGLIGLIAWFIPIFSYVACIPGLIFGLQSKKIKHSWQSTAGITLNIISICLAVINSIIGVIINLNSIF
ncbi:MAG: hypothetical protein RSB67_01280 [Clostridia bacterium]